MVHFYQRWTCIDLADPATLPPLREAVLLYLRGPGFRDWRTFHSENERGDVLQKYGYTHWREEMTVDSP